MEIINENLTEKQTKGTVNPQNCHKRRQRLSSFDVNIKERITMTAQDIDNKQKLYDFISGGKNKLSLKTHFDHKGTKEFLLGKNEAMKKIELDESIEENNKIKKKVIKRKSVSNLKSNKSQKMLTKIDSINLNNIKKRKKNSLSTKNIDIYKNKLSSIKQPHITIGFEDGIPPPNLKPHTQINSGKKSRKSPYKKKNKNKKKSVNVDKSINSIKTIDSKLFSDKKDYEHYKQNFLNKDDTSFLEVIINELDLNKEEKL
jgi:hypothetical protein